MGILMFQKNISLITVFIHKLQRENVPMTLRQIFIKHYSDDLNIHLTDTMIKELLYHQKYFYS
ncbi:hypothetical protein [Marinisporobacter balticus]|uniref:Uncharacterized protein n=1 Tax=Marinisporobacter balticus TaxID=2018667 RepID=A0A4R2KY86_9FIRM|nr:hypothetical protein [Marinisporobacter balticus]TCO75238.1 hypothetical protein EV214_10975 [Marinisporobacter balticus]